MKRTQPKIGLRAWWIAGLMSGAAICVCCRLTIADSITATMRQNDPRLEQRVSFVAHRIYTGQLTQRLEELTGTVISADDRTGAADQIVAVYLREVPLHVALDALWALFSHRGAEYHWRQDGIEGKYSYTLTRSLSAKEFQSRIQSEVQTTFEQDAAEIARLLASPPKEQEERAKKNDAIAALLKEERTKAGLKTFFETLPAEAQSSVLRGNQRPKVPVDRLSPEGRAFVRNAWKEYDGVRILEDGSRVPIPEPTSVTFYTDKNPLTVPTLLIDIEGIGGYGYLGGLPLQDKVRNHLRDLWMLPGDSRQSPENDVTIKVATPSVVNDRDTVLAQRLGEFSDATGVSIVARLPKDTRTVRDPGSPDKLSVAAWIERLTQPISPYLMHKWRGSALLISHEGWYLEPNSPPWRIARLVIEKAARTGRLSILDFIELAGRLDPSELNQLSVEFKVLAAIANWCPLFRRLAESPELTKAALSEKGAPIAQLAGALSTVRQLSPILGKPDIAGSTVRLFESDELGGSVMLRIISADGNVLGAAGFVYRKQ